MKKAICLCSLLLAALASSFAEEKGLWFRGFIPLDFSGRLTTSFANVDYHYDTNFGGGIGAEVVANVWEGLRAGAGLQGNFGRGIDDKSYDEASFGYVPVYGIVSYRFDLGTVNPYGVARLGYNIPTGNREYKMSGDLVGGAYFAIGAGVEVRVHGWAVTPFAELNYAYDSSGIENSSKGDYNVSYKRAQLCLGVAYFM